MRVPMGAIDRESFVSTSIENMIALIQECRTRNNDLGRTFSAGSISDICNHIGLPFLIDSLTKAGRHQHDAYARDKALAQLRSFGSGSGEFYFAEAMKPSIVNIVSHKSARVRWIHELIQEGETKTEAITRVLKLWDVPENSPQLDKHTITVEYERWLQQQGNPPTIQSS